MQAAHSQSFASTTTLQERRLVLAHCAPAEVCVPPLPGALLPRGVHDGRGYPTGFACLVEPQQTVLVVLPLCLVRRPDKLHRVRVDFSGVHSAGHHPHENAQGLDHILDDTPEPLSANLNERQADVRQAPVGLAAEGHHGARHGQDAEEPSAVQDDQSLDIYIGIFGVPVRWLVPVNVFADALGADLLQIGYVELSDVWGVPGQHFPKHVHDAF